MQYHNLGESGLKVSRVIVGCMTYGSPDWQGWVLNEEQSLPILKHAYDNGINTWDVGALLDLPYQVGMLINDRPPTFIRTETRSA